MVPLDLSCERGFSFRNDDWAVKEEVSCCFDILTAVTNWGYTVLEVAPEFVIT